ncbi:rare lipoprotein A [Methylohalomonas lacus]|uniref:Endolytic peptidoglycan transglycosylase RlpA n=1 Tax=Methylohalomonas lacus TaxID=398773 RepID=A0AAE3L5D4_9GAMM|nr:septal ring lytic transglycosylase RlpA family protein [Methylohalomonas lacus]MCS3903162.1 rare lipoprotein A [Methylohalomonas lacus]
MGYQFRFYLLGLIIVAATLQGCGGSKSVKSPEQDRAPARPRDVSNIPDAVPKDEPRSRYGNPESYEVFGKRYHVMQDGSGYVERGIASWYGTKFHGRRTSSGESYDMYAMTAAHKSLPLPTYVEVINLQNRNSVVVKVNDRGPFHENRIIDMSYAAASKLGMLDKGTALVEVRTIEPDRYQNNEVRHVSEGSGRNVRPDTVKSIEEFDEFFIQIGAFSDLSNAERLRARLGSIEDKYAKIYQAVVDNTTLYRVRIGPLTDVATADRIVSKLSNYGIDNHHIVFE